jgi:hypothetical protein
MSTTITQDVEEDGEWTRKSTRAWLAPSCTWRRRGQTFSFLCVCALIFRRRQGLHIGRPSSGYSGIFDTLMSLVFGTRRPLPFCFLIFWMLILRGVELIGNRLRVLANFWVPRLFLGHLANNCHTLKFPISGCEYR